MQPIRKFWRAGLILLLLTMLWQVTPGYADPQSQADRIIVAYTTGHREGSYQINDTSGFSRLSQIVNSLGGVVREIELTEPVASEIDLLIVAGPKRPRLTDGEVSRIWSYLEQGGNLLILNDPPPNQGLQNRSGLNDLLWRDYGIRWREDMLVFDWFSFDTASVVNGRSYTNEPRRVAGQAALPVPGHEITAALVDQNFAVYHWLSRSLEMYAPAMRGDPHPLLVTLGIPFGETRLERDMSPLYNIDKDTAPSEHTIAAAVEDVRSGSRIVVIGDSNLFMNGYGLEQSVNGNFVIPVYGGNEALAQLVLRWLLKLPLEEWSLPHGVIQFTVDGSAADWEAIHPQFTASAEGQGITEIRLSKSDRRLYGLFQTSSSETPTQILLEMTDINGEPYSVTLDTNFPDMVRYTQSEESFTVGGAQVASGEGIEITIPRFLVPETSVIRNLCITQGDQFCTELRITSVVQSGYEPRTGQILPDLPTAKVHSTTGLTLWTEPDTASMQMMRLDFGAIVSIMDRDDSGEWVKAWIDGMQGWLQVEFLQLAEDEHPIRER